MVKEFKQAVKDAFDELPESFELCDLNGNDIAPDILDDPDKCPPELRIKGNTKVRKDFIPIQNAGQLEIIANKINCPSNVLEELCDNSIEAIRKKQEEDNSFQGKITATVEQGRLLFSDNGPGVKAEDLERSISIGMPQERKAGEGKNFADMMRGLFGRYGMGLNSIAKFGMELKKLCMRFKSKASHAQNMAVAEQNYEELFSGNKAYKTAVEYDPNLDERFFSRDGTRTATADTQHFVGAHGTVIVCDKCDPNCAAVLCEGSTGKLKTAFLRQLAARYFLYLDPTAYNHLRELALRIGCEVGGRERSEAIPSQLQSDVLHANRFAPIQMFVNGASLADQHNVVSARVKEIVSGEGDDKTWCISYTITHGGKSARVLVFLRFTDRDDDDDAKDSAEEDCEGNEEEEAADNDPAPQLLVFWNGLLLHKEEQMALPWMEKAKREAKFPRVKEAFSRVNGMVFVGSEMEPEGNKTHLSQNSLYKELKQMQSKPGSRVKDVLAGTFKEKLVAWSDADQKFHYGDVLGETEEGFAREWVKNREAANGARGKDRKARNVGLFKAQTEKEDGTFVEFVASDVKKKGKGKGKGAAKGSASVGYYGTIIAIFTSTRDDTGNAGTVHIDVPFSKQEVVSVSKIVRAVHPDEKKKKLSEIEKALPSAVRLLVYAPEGKDLEDAEKERCGVRTVAGNPYVPAAGFDVESDDSTAPVWTLRRDQINDFQILAEVVDGNGCVVTGADAEAPGQAGVMDLSQLTMTFELLDTSNVPVTDAHTGEDWTDKIQPFEGSSATFFTVTHQVAGEKPLNHYLSAAGTNVLRIRAQVNLEGQSEELRDHVETMHQGPPPGLSCTIDIRIIPSKPTSAVVSLEPFMRLGERQPLKVELLDRFLTRVSAIGTVTCQAQDFEVDVEEDNKWVVIQGQNAPDKLDRKVRLQFEIIPNWTDQSSVAEKLGLALNQQLEGMAPLLASDDVVVLSGPAEQVRVEGPGLDAAVRMEPLNCKITVTDHWDNPVVGHVDAVTFRLELDVDERMVQMQDARELEVPDIVRGVVFLATALPTVVCGDFGSEAPLIVRCHTKDHRPKQRRVKHSTAEGKVSLRVEEARLVFVVPSTLGESGNKLAVSVDVGTASELSDVKLQIERPTGEVILGRTDAAVAADDLQVQKVWPGASEAETEVPLTVENGVAVLPPDFILGNEPREYFAEFCGVHAQLSVRPQAGPPASCSIDSRTDRHAKLGSPWQIFLRVRDINGILVTTPCFQVELQADTALSLPVKPDKLVYDTATGLFSATCEPRGLLNQLPSVSNVQVVLHCSQSPHVVDVEGLPVEVSAGAATKLQIVLDGVVGSSSSYTSGERLELKVQAVDQDGNVAHDYNHKITLKGVECDGLDGLGGKLFSETVSLQNGVGKLPDRSQRHFTTANAFVVTAEQLVKRGSAAQPQVEGTLSTVQVRRGKWASNIELLHPRWNERHLILDDSTQDLEGMLVKVVADDGSDLRDVTLLLKAKTRDGMSVLRSQASPNNPFEHKFEACAIPFEAGGYDLTIELEKDPHGPSAGPSKRKTIKVVREHGQASSVKLRAWVDNSGDYLDDVAIAPNGPVLFLELVVLNRLGVPIPRKELQESRWEDFVKFAAKEEHPGLELHVEELESDDTDPPLRFKATLNEVAEIEDVVSVVIKGTANIVGGPLESSNDLVVTYTPKAQIARLTEQQKAVLEQVTLKKQELKQAQANCAKVEEARNAVNKLEEQIKKCKSAHELDAEEIRLQGELGGVVALAPANWFPDSNPHVQAVLDAIREKSLPQGIQVIGFAAELGYVPPGCDELAEGIAAIAGTRLQALVLAGECDADAIEQDRQDAIEQQGSQRYALLCALRTLPMTKPCVTLDDRGLVRFTDPPPASLPNGARYAVNDVMFEKVAVDQDVKQRLRAEVWWWLVGSAIIFSCVSDLQAFKQQHGRKHTMAAARSDGSWLVIHADIAKTGGNAPLGEPPKLAKLSVEQRVEDSAEYRAIKQELDAAAKCKREREALETKLKQAQEAASLSQPQDWEGETKRLESEISTLESKLSGTKEDDRSTGKSARAPEAAEESLKKSRRGDGGSEAGAAISTPPSGGKRAVAETPETMRKKAKRAVGEAAVVSTRSSPRTRKGDTSLP